MFEAKPHQLRCVEEIDRRRAKGVKFRTCITSVTGSGKSWVIMEIIRREVARGGHVVLYSNRKLLTEQIIRQIQAEGVHFGCRAADFEEHEDADARVQLCSMQTEMARVFAKRKKSEMSEEVARRQFPLARATLGLVDVVHLQKGATNQNILNEHYSDGASIIGVTATPLRSRMSNASRCESGSTCRAFAST